MSNHPTVNMHLSGDLQNLMRGLALTAQAIPPGAYRDGYEAALGVVATALGVQDAPMPVPVNHHGSGCAAPVILDVIPRRRDDYEPPRRGPVTVNVFEDLSHESVPYPFSAFANMGR